MDEMLGSGISFSLFPRTDGNCVSSQCSQYLAVFFPENPEERDRYPDNGICVCAVIPGRNSSWVTAPNPFPPSWQGGFAQISKILGDLAGRRSCSEDFLGFPRDGG